MSDTPRKNVSLSSSKGVQHLDAVTQSAHEQGFGRSQAVAETKVQKIDGRSLRRTGRTQQLNMRISPETHRRFWTAAKNHGFQTGEALLNHLLDMDKTNLHSK